MSSNLIFTPVQGEESKIRTLGNQPGWLYFATDTGRMFLDTDQDERVILGGSGAAIYYGNAASEDITEIDGEIPQYVYPITSVQQTGVPKVDDIILDKHDGTFYRIVKITKENFLCERLSISGTGGGSSIQGTLRPTLTILDEYLPSNIINGQTYKVRVKSAAAKDQDGNYIPTSLVLHWKMQNKLTGLYYKEDAINLENNVEKEIDFTSYLKDSTTTSITMYVSGTNHEKDSLIQTLEVTSSELKLELPIGFHSTSVFSNPNDVVLNCNVIGNVRKLLYCYFGDGNGEDEKLELLEEKGRILKENDDSNQPFKIPVNLATHGYHTVRFELYFIKDDNTPDLSSKQTLEFEIAIIVQGNMKPIIWLGNIKDKYYNYEDIRLYYRLYNPNNTGINNSVSLKRFGIYQTSRQVSGGAAIEAGKFDDFEISNASTDQINKYSICFGNEDNKEMYVERIITFEVLIDANKQMNLIETPNFLFSPIGRSNSEPYSSRIQWPKDPAPDTEMAVFENFNWVNNGWMLDEKTNKTALVVTNGAKVKFPLGTKRFGGSNQSEEAHTIEIMFKVNNIEKYDSLITNHTRYENDTAYEIEKGSPKVNLWDEFINKNGHTFINYDSFLQWKLGAQYDNLKFAGITKEIHTEHAICRYYDNKNGLCLGVQDVFFTAESNTVNTAFVEDEIINLTFVYSNELQLLQIYINGMISGVAKSQGFNINSQYLEFDSSICDIYIYGIRTYNKALLIPEIVQNYSVDKKDVNLFDQKSMIDSNLKMKESLLDFNKMLTYYKNHPNKIQMPYIIFDTSANTSSFKTLPYSKATDNSIQVEFINAPLDKAYLNGELEKYAVEDGLCSSDDDPDVKLEAIKFYYKHHCPSWTSTIRQGDKVNISVQGTSSEYYPRRNYKIKTKMDFDNTWDEVKGEWTEKDNLNIFLHKGPYEEIYNNDKILLKDNPKYLGKEKSRMTDGWYMDNYTNATDRWTMKVDYMESSGSYNAGFANMMGSAYKKHPLKDLVDNNVITNVDKLKPVTEEYTSLKGREIDITVKNSSLLDSNTGIKWDDYRTSLQGFPVMAFWKKADNDYIFIGYYRMLLDKGSSENTGFKVDGKITHKYVNNKKLKDVVECWEFSNNSRTFCSFRDPYNRTEFSFNPPGSEKDEYFTSDQAPLVANSFEARYHKDKDALEALMYYKDVPPKPTDDALYMSIQEINTQYGTNLRPWQAGDYDARAMASDLFLSFHRNWEKACKWVWSTCTDHVCKQNEYSKIELYEELFDTNKTYYTQQTNDEGKVTYIPYVGTFNENIIYYTKEIEINDKNEQTEIYRVIRLTNNPNVVYAEYKYYRLVVDKDDPDDNEYALAFGAYDNNIIYYQASEDPAYKNIANLLVEKASGIFNPNEEYYLYDGTKPINAKVHNGAVVKVENPQSADFDKYYVKKPVEYNGITYQYDTKEYRSAKFINELDKHFDLEYLAVYFVMTEVFECYDSRGKNCMMASWGPQEVNGDYIWYPIFYDIDTQLGINNTGIPSFEFNVDATENKNYSTSDSILWNNFYNYFKNSWILGMYQLLRNEKSSISSKQLTNPPLASIDTIESWYTFNPERNGMIACRGERPLIVTNLDSYWKYITITNNFLSEAEQDALNENDYFYGRWGYQGQTKGYIIDEDGSYFYALQGDRSQARRAFLANRIDYIDSWLNVGTYKRAGGMQIRGRISANDTDASDISDHWIEKDGEPYWIDEKNKIKAHEFDAEYWVNLTPVRSSYVTVGDDSEAYPSQKYDPNIGPVSFKLIDLENGIRKSPDYPEQLLYIYGLQNLTDVGDLSKLYWREFFLDGKAPKLTRLKLGHDALSNDEQQPWKSKINGLNIFPDGGLPLLKEANFSNITITSNKTNIPLTASKKLRNFRATGSNITEVQFADGVALDTLYLPKTITSLKLNQANQLTVLHADKENYPKVQNISGNLIAPEGMYIEGLFDDPISSDLITLDLRGGSLGYNSYKLLDRLYTKGMNLHADSNVNNDKIISLSLMDVNWCPYEKVYSNEKYDNNIEYYIDQGHYKFEPYYHVSEDNFNIQVLNNIIFKKRDIDNTQVSLINNNIITMLIDLVKYDYFKAVVDTNASPLLTGIIYINNDSTNINVTLNGKQYTQLNEAFVAALQEYYPGVQFFFKDIIQSYSAKFIIQDNETGIWEYVDIKNNTSSDKIPSVQKIADFVDGTRFNDPFIEYSPKKVHYDFKGWSTYPTYQEAITNNDLIVSSEEWNTYNKALLEENIFDYTYYAIFVPHEYSLKFYNLLDSSYGDQVDNDGNYYYETKVVYGNMFIETPYMPYAEALNVDLEDRNGFRGWSLKAADAQIVYEKNQNLEVAEAIIDISKYSEIDQDYTLYAVFQKESVYTNNTPYKYFKFTYDYNNDPIIHLNNETLEMANALSGKITLPAKDPEGKYIKKIGNFAGVYETASVSVPYGNNITHIFFESNSQYEEVLDSAFICNIGNPRKLLGIYLPETIKKIGHRAFLWNSLLKHVFNADGDWRNTQLEFIGQSAFKSSPGQLIVTHLPSSLKIIENRAFDEQEQISINKIPDSATFSGSENFSDCHNINIVDFGQSGKLTEIPEKCFYNAGLNSITNIYVYKNITFIGKQAFEGYGNDNVVMYTEHSEGDVNWDPVSIGVSKIEYDWNGIH